MEAICLDLTAGCQSCLVKSGVLLTVKMNAVFTSFKSE